MYYVGMNTPKTHTIRDSGYTACGKYDVPLSSQPTCKTCAKYAATKAAEAK